MARSDPQVNIRMPLDLKEQLEAVLGETGRSLNAEIVKRLQDSFDSSSRPVINISADSYEEALALMGRLLLAGDAMRPESPKRFDTEMRDSIQSVVEKAESMDRSKKKPKP